jgi:transketolase
MEEKIIRLENISKEIRKDILNMIYNAKSGHPGGSLSCVDILVSLYDEIMDLSLDNKNCRIDRFVLSKGHAAPAYYAILSYKGFIPKSDLNTLRKYDSYLEGHPTNKINGVDVSSGSLGQGLSIANGMALSKKISNEEGYVYCLLGDGEMQEGQIWEALMSANKYKLSNLIAFIDFNKLQIDGKVDEVMPLESLEDKLNAFNLNVEKINGHSHKEIIDAVDRAKRQDKATFIIANTIKGKGVSFMENDVSWHGKAPSEEEYNKALKELM